MRLDRVSSARDIFGNTALAGAHAPAQAGTGLHLFANGTDQLFMSAVAERAPVLSPRPARIHAPATLCILLVDVVAVEIALCLGLLLRVALHPLFSAPIGRPQYVGLSLGVLTVPLAYYWVGLYSGYGIGPIQRLRSRVSATLLVFSVLLAWDYVFENGRWSRAILLSTMMFALTVAPALEAVARKLLFCTGVRGAPVIIIGGGATGNLLVQRLQNEPDLGLRPIAILDEDHAKWGTGIHGVPIAGPISSARMLQKTAHVAIVAMPDIDSNALADVIESLAFPIVIVVPDLPGVQTLWTVTRDLGGVLGLELQKNLLIAKNRILKRALDYLLAIPLFIVAAPLIGILALWIRFVSPAPAFFKQQREGKDGKCVAVWKLRTMYPDAEQVLCEYLETHPGEKMTWLRYYKLKRDPRVLPGIGWFLRRFSLDELPQLWNVIRGEMSLVGPRPFPYYHLDGFSARFRLLRRSVVPGLTGLWQVSARSEGDLCVQESLDTYYIRNWSPWLDLYILLRTIRSVVIPRGAY
jgi:Undecaprenyl-phosphate galactose phosphotransferase WbaP